MMARFVLGLTLSLAAIGVARAGAPPPPDLSTDMIVSYVPAGWKNSVLSGGAGAELAEFTPTGQPTETFTDLVGFTKTPLRPGVVIPPDHDFVGPTKAGLPTKCSTSVVRSVAPVASRPGSRYVQTFCVLSSGPAAGHVDVTFLAFYPRPKTLFSVWRSWRGTPEQFQTFLAQSGGAVPGQSTRDVPAAGFDEGVIDRVTPKILAAWARTFSAPEFCDLALGEICPSFRSPAQGLPSGFIASVSIRGSHELTAEQAVRLQAKMSGPAGEMGQKLVAQIDSGTPVPHIEYSQSISLADHDWADPRGLMQAILMPGLGARADGGSLVALDGAPPADAPTRARMQAYVVLVSHVLWRLGMAPDRVTVILRDPS